MATQTGSIDLTATNGVKLYAAAGFESAGETYATKTEFGLAVDGITSRVTAVEEATATVANPNMYPLFSTSLDDLAESRESDDGYWYVLDRENYQAVADCVTILSDGWSHWEYDNSGGSALVGVGVLFARDTFGLKANTTYTAMFEVRDVTSPGTGTTGWTFTSASATDAQVKQNASGLYLDYNQDLADGDTVVYKQFTANNYAAGNMWLAAFYVGVGAGAVLSADIRISCYEGVYNGPYKPFVDSSLHNRMLSAETSITQNSEAISLRATKTEANQLAQPNLSPFFEVAYEKGDYWKNGGTFTAGIWTTLSDGWAHFERANTGSSEVSNLLRMAACPSVVQGQQYTCLLEFRNVSVTGNTNTYMYTQQSSYAQFWGNHSYDGWTINNSDIAALAGGKGEFRKLMTARGVSLHESTGIQLIDINQKVSAGQTISYDIRISLYAGEYTGPWKPYSGSQLYASKSELKVQSDRIGMVVSNADASSSLQLTADAMQYIGSHVEITDEAGTSTVISGGKIVADNLHVKSANIDGTLVIGQLPDEAKNSNVQIGGTNLLRNTEFPFSGTELILTSSRSTLVQDMARMTPNASAAAYAKWRVDYLDYSRYGNDTYTFSFDARIQDTTSSYTATRVSAYIGVNAASRVGSIMSSTYDRYVLAQEFTDLTTEWKRYSVTAKVPDDLVTGDAGALVAGSQLTVELGVKSSSRPVEARRWKLERGTKATDWSPSPEDKAVVSGRNLLLGTSEPKVVTTAATGGSYYSDYYAESDWGKAKTNGNTSSVMSVSLDWTYTGDNGEMWVQIGSNIIANVLSAEGYGSRGMAYIDLVGGSGHYQALFRLTATQAGNDTQRIRIRVVGTTSGKPLTANATLTVSNVMYEVATVPGVWSPAPEDQTAYTDDVAGSLSGRIEDLLATTEAIDGRTQAFEMSETDGLTISSKAEGGSADFNINIKGEAIKFRYQQKVLATASISGFDAPHLGAGTDLTIGPRWRLQWQEYDDRLVLVYV